MKRVHLPPPQPPFSSPENAADPDAVSRVALHVVQPDGSIEEGEVALQPADIMVANILARPLVELAPRIAALTRCGGGQIVLAGLLEEQVGGCGGRRGGVFGFGCMEMVFGLSYTSFACTP